MLTVPSPPKAVSQSTRPKRNIEKNYGSFHLEGLMQKAADKRVELVETEKEKATKTQAIAEGVAKKKADLLAYQLCMRACICPDGACKWTHHTICGEPTCAGLISPMSSCTSSVCRVLKLQQKKADAEAKKNWTPRT